MTKDEALRLALEALELQRNDPFNFNVGSTRAKAINAIKEVLVQTEKLTTEETV